MSTCLCFSVMPQSLVLPRVPQKKLARCTAVGSGSSSCSRTTFFQSGTDRMPGAFGLSPVAPSWGPEPDGSPKHLLDLARLKERLLERKWNRGKVTSRVDWLHRASIPRQCVCHEFYLGDRQRHLHGSLPSRPGLERRCRCCWRRSPDH